MLQYNCRKNVNNCATPDIRKTTPYLWPKKVETDSSSKAVARNLGEEPPLDRSFHNKMSNTDWCRMTKIARNKLKLALYSAIRI